MWQAWINFVLGVLVLIFAYTQSSFTWFAIAGILVVIFSLWGALTSGGRKMM
jgi:hypothetical protein